LWGCEGGEKPRHGVQRGEGREARNLSRRPTSGRFVRGTPEGPCGLESSGEWIGRGASRSRGKEGVNPGGLPQKQPHSSPSILKRYVRREQGSPAVLEGKRLKKGNENAPLNLRQCLSETEERGVKLGKGTKTRLFEARAFQRGRRLKVRCVGF